MIGGTRGGFFLTVAIMTLVGGCGWFDGDRTVVSTKARPGADQAVALSAGLPSASSNRQYVTGDVPVDEARSAQIGSIVRDKGGQKAQLEALAKETQDADRKARVETDRRAAARREADAAAAAAVPPKTSPADPSQTATAAPPAAPAAAAVPPSGTTETPPPPAQPPAVAVAAPVVASAPAPAPVVAEAQAPVVAEAPAPVPAARADVNKAFQPPPGWAPPGSSAAPAAANVPPPTPAPPPAAVIAAPVVEPVPAPAPIAVAVPAARADVNKAFQPPAGWTPPMANAAPPPAPAPLLATAPPPPPSPAVEAAPAPAPVVVAAAAPAARADANKAFQPPVDWTPPTANAAPAPAPAPLLATAPPPPAPAVEPAPAPAPVVVAAAAPAARADANKAFQPPADWTPPTTNAALAAPIVAPPTAPAPPPLAAAPPPVTAPPPIPETTPAPNAPVASTPPPPEAPRPTLATVAFRPQSAEITGAGRIALERVAQSASAVRMIQLRAYATGSDFKDARNVALARGLVVRTYLIDHGVRARIEVGAFASDSSGAGSDRVDVIGP